MSKDLGAVKADAQEVLAILERSILCVEAEQLVRQAVVFFTQGNKVVGRFS